MAEVEITINGRPSGAVYTGWGVDASTVAINDASAAIDIKVTVAGESGPSFAPGSRRSSV